MSIWWAFPPLTTIPWSYRKGRNLLRICCEMGVLSIYESGAYAPRTENQSEILLSGHPYENDGS